jgi:molybdopterin biosynthesis enzyme MoaB
MSRLVISFPNDLTRDAAEAIRRQVDSLSEEEWRTVVLAAGGTITDLDVPSVVTDDDVERIARRVVELLKAAA